MVGASEVLKQPLWSSSMSTGVSFQLGVQTSSHWSGPLAFQSIHCQCHFSSGTHPLAAHSSSSESTTVVTGCGGGAFELTPGGVPEEDALECIPGGGPAPEALELTPGVEAVGSGGELPPRSEFVAAGSRGGRGFVHNSVSPRAVDTRPDKG